MTFSRIVSKITRKGGELAMKNTLVVLTVLAFVLMTAPAYAILVGTDSGPIPITATVSAVTGGLDVTISKVVVSYSDPNACTGRSEVFTPLATLAMPFGTLWFDTINRVFRTGTTLNNGFYYAMDVGVIDNSGRNWQINVTPTTMTSGSANLDTNMNVVYAKVHKTATTDSVTPINTVTYQSSTYSIGKAQLITATEANWLRAMYGVASGLTTARNECPADATGATPITLDKPTGTYSGTVRVTLTYL